MREWALHVMDLIENSLRAGASVVSVGVSAAPATGTLDIVVEDNGAGLDIPLDRAGDPFYTTKPRKAVGLGLSLFKTALEEAGGSFVAERPECGGLRITGIVPLKNVDRKPLGDLAETIWTLAVANPDVEFRLQASVDDNVRALSWHEVRVLHGGVAANPLQQGKLFLEQARAALADVSRVEQEQIWFADK